MSVITQDTSAPSPWAAAVANALGNRAATEECEWRDDANALYAALEALVASGRCVAYSPGLTPLGVQAIARATTNLFGFNGGHISSSTNETKHLAIALQGESDTWIATATCLTYLPARPGAPAERTLFQLSVPTSSTNAFINEVSLGKLGHALYLGRTAVLLADRELDVPWLLSANNIDVTDLDGLGEAVRHSRRASYVSPEERASKERAIAAIRDMYEKQRGPKPRPLSESDVDVIVDAALDRGLLPNLELIHAVTGGRGSPNQTYPKIHAAVFRRANRQARAEHDLDPGLLDVWNRIRNAAISAAEKAIAPLRDELVTEKAELAAEKVDLVARERDLRAKSEALKSVQDDLNQKLDEREKTIRRLEGELARAQRDLGQSQRQLTAAQADVATLTARQENAEAERDREQSARRTAETEREHAARAAEALVQQRDAANARAARAEGTSAESEGVLRATQHALAVEQATGTTLRESIATLGEQLDRQRQETHEAMQRNGRLEGTVDGLRADLVRLYALEAQLAALKETHAGVTGELIALRQERDRLVASANTHEPPAASGT